MAEQREAAGGFIGKFDALMSVPSVESEQAITVQQLLFDLRECLGKLVACR